jgi:EAL domain-containing protein (putative c-di-GMP-specific phosphodiesterase class I)
MHTMAGNRLLVVDDDEDLGLAVAELAAQCGYETMHLTDPLDARFHLADWEPDVIVTDLQMPSFDGVAFLRNLAAKGCKAKVIIVSGMDQKLIDTAGKLSEERGLDVVATFAKPFSNAAIKACLSELKATGPITPAAVDTAVRTKQMGVYLQPKVDTLSGRVTGAEALVRWHCPSRGIVRPDCFLSHISDLGLDDSLFDTVVTRALQTVARCRDAGLICENFNLAINMTATNLLNLSLPDRVRAMCELHDWPTTQITLELTETSSMDETLDVIDVLTRLRLMGISLSVDDFGTGYSSLLRLRQLPFTELKIDRSFTSLLLTSRDSQVIFKTILTMARSLGLNPVAEGVEDQAIRDEVAALGCRTSQGYYFSAPLSPDGFAKWLAVDGKGGGSDTSSSAQPAMALAG